MNSYSEFLKNLDQRSQFGIKLGLQNITQLLQKLSHPQSKYDCIHIAGTNGKGSVAAMLSAVLTAAGLKVGLYTSPHLVSVRERIRVGEREITEGEILTVARKVIAFARAETTYFELLTAIALEFFWQQQVDFAILETGMGGRLDATNACPAGIAVITNISLEHEKYLGKTISQIAAEKAAIIKQGAKIVSGVLNPKAAEVISKAAVEKGAELNQLGKEFSYGVSKRSLSGQEIQVKTAKRNYDKLGLNLLGNHQAANCALAVKVLELLLDRGYSIPLESLYQGLNKVNWPGRFEVISRDPLMIIDGAHNPAGCQVLKETIEKYLTGKKIILIFGVLKDKNFKEMAKVLFPSAEHIFAVTPNDQRGLAAGELADGEAVVIEKVEEALSRARGIADKDSAIIIAGSLYLAGEVLQCG